VLILLADSLMRDSHFFAIHRLFAPPWRLPARRVCRAANKPSMKSDCKSEHVTPQD